MSLKTSTLDMTSSEMQDSNPGTCSLPRRLRWNLQATTRRLCIGFQPEPVHSLNSAASWVARWMTHWFFQTNELHSWLHNQSRKRFFCACQGLPQLFLSLFLWLSQSASVWVVDHILFSSIYHVFLGAFFHNVIHPFFSIFDIQMNSFHSVAQLPVSKKWRFFFCVWKFVLPKCKNLCATFVCVRGCGDTTFHLSLGIRLVIFSLWFSGFPMDL